MLSTLRGPRADCTTLRIHAYPVDRNAAILSANTRATICHVYSLTCTCILHTSPLQAQAFQANLQGSVLTMRHPAFCAQWNSEQKPYSLEQRQAVLGISQTACADVAGTQHIFHRSIQAESACAFMLTREHRFPHATRPEREDSRDMISSNYSNCVHCLLCGMIWQLHCAWHNNAALVNS